MTPDPTRRRVLQLSGAGATASLAGCTSIFSDSERELNADSEPDIDPAEGITAIVQPPDDALQGVQQEVSDELESGEISREEAQLEMRERQQELFLSRSIEFEGELSDTNVSIEAAIGEHGAFLLTGSDEGLVDLLRNNDVEALLPGEEYEAALQAQSGADPGAEPEPEPDPDEDAGDADDADDADADSNDSDSGDGSVDDEEDGGSDDGSDADEESGDDTDTNESAD